MAVALQVHAWHPDIEEYQRLLKCDFTKDTLKSVLSLLWKLIAKSAKPSTYEWQRVLVYPPKVAQIKHVDQHIINTIRQTAEILEDPRIPTMPSSFSDARSDRSIVQAQQVWTYLCVQLLARLVGEPGIFVDLQSLLFLCTTEELLPALRDQRLLSEHDCLVNALYIHTVVVWRNDPAHQYYLQSVLMDYLGDLRSVLQLHVRSLKLTDVQDHSYLTKAQAVWSDFMDSHQYKDAYHFLIHLLRYSPLSCEPELQDMLTTTVKVAANGSRR